MPGAVRPPCAAREPGCRARLEILPLRARARVTSRVRPRGSLPLGDYGNGCKGCQLTFLSHVPGCMQAEMAAAPVRYAARAVRFSLPSGGRIRIFSTSSLVARGPTPHWDENRMHQGSARAMLTADQIRDLLKLRPLPIEGGYFAESYRSAQSIPQSALPSDYPDERAMSTAIYYLLTPDTFSAMHRLRGDETYHFYLGDPVEMLELKPDGAGEAILLGREITSGMRLQHTVRGGF